MKNRLILHGGAWNIPDALQDAHMHGIREALTAVSAELIQGMTALDATEMAVRMLEADPTYDAGRGAFLNSKGEIELDAMIMDGRTLDFGAVAAIQNVLHPISVARVVMTESEHCILVGKGAQDFAKAQGIEETTPEDLLTERELATWQRLQKDSSFRTHQPFDKPMGTVGAVAMDNDGNLAAATSTGGTPQKLAGRVGDTPIIGAGTYADNELGAASATGWGESILKVMLTRQLCDLFGSMPAGQAAKAVIKHLQERVKGLGGVIGIDSNGNYAFHHNTPYMAFGYMEEGGKIVVNIQIRK